MARCDDPGVSSQQETLLEAIGGPLGILETSLPAVAFVVVYAASGSDTSLAAIVALAVAAALSAVRLARRQSPRHALTGLVGVAFAAFIAQRTGRAENFFLPGLLFNAAAAAAFAVSALVRRPLVAVITVQLTGEGGGWRSDPQRLRAFTLATWLWAAVFAARTAVQLPLYLAGAVVALGVARTAMGIPLLALALWATWRLVRRPAPAG